MFLFTISMPKSGACPVMPKTVVFKYLSCPARSMKVITLVERSHILTQSKDPWSALLTMLPEEKQRNYKSRYEARQKEYTKFYHQHRNPEYHFQQNSSFQIPFRVCVEIVSVWPALDHYPIRHESVHPVK